MDAANDDSPERAEIDQLKAEHRDLDAAIARLTETPSEDQLLLRRLKKRKLLLKDRIAALERARDPDEYA